MRKYQYTAEMLVRAKISFITKVNVVIYNNRVVVNLLYSNYLISIMFSPFKLENYIMNIQNTESFL